MSDRPSPVTMTTHSNIKLTIAFNDPDLDPEELDEQAQRLMAELKQMDEVVAIGSWRCR